MFDAKVVAATMPVALRISSVIAGPMDISERPACGEKMFVLSQTSALTPSLAISSHRAVLNGSPTTGVMSTLKSPVCTMRPAAESITRPALSGIEWLIGT